MLKPAILYKEQVQEKGKVVLQYPERYMFWNNSSYLTYTDFSLDDKDEWIWIKRVSVDSNDKVLGYLTAEVCRFTDDVVSLCFMNFNLGTISITFVRDMERFLMSLLDIYRKVSFSVVVGNPAERLYDKVIEKYHGRIVGVKKQDVRLIDGKYYDLKLYEILKETK